MDAQQQLTQDIDTLIALSLSARILSLDQARNILDVDMNLAFLPRTKLMPTDSKVRISTNVIDDVEFLTVRKFDSSGNITDTSPDPIAPTGLDVRFAVFIIRLVRRLKQKFSVDTI